MSAVRVATADPDSTAMGPDPLGGWTSPGIDAECKAAYEAYAAEVREQHVAYFATRPERRSERLPFAARSRRAALPDGWEWVADALGVRAWHRHHLSGGSSQVLALTLLTSAAAADPSLRWLSGDAHFASPRSLFEVELAPGVLNERPRQTSVDWLVVDRDHVVAAEAKFTERGLGTCSCDAESCSPRVLERPYWDVATGDFGLEREHRPCELSVAYQAVRNVAAAKAIAGRRRTTFLLLHDERNPYFAGSGAWPGWVKMLSQSMSRSRTRFASLSWQELLARVDLDPEVKAWAREKHGLVGAV